MVSQSTKISKNNLESKFKAWPKVTIYILNKNYGKFIKQSIQSVINQSYTNWELFIIDDFSEDNSKKIINQTIKINNKINKIFNNKSIGVAKNANIVIKKSKGEYLLRLDADDWLTEDALLYLVLEIEKNKNLSIVFGNYYYVDERGILLGEEENFILNKNNYIKQIPPHGACTLFNLNDLKNKGGYSEDVIAQDGWDVWYKLFNKNKISNINKKIFYYRQHNKSLSKNKGRIVDARTKILNNLKIKNKKKIICLAVIPVKESYPLTKDVPFLKFENKTLLEHVLLSTQKSKKITNITISTASKKVIDYVKSKISNNKITLIKRPNNISKSASQLAKTLIHASKSFYKQNKYFPDLIIYLSLHTIRRNEAYIDQAINTLLIKKYDSVISVNEEKDPIFLYNPISLKPMNISRFEDKDKLSEKIYRFNGSFIVVKNESLMKDNIFGNNIGHIEMLGKDIIEIKDFNILKNV